MAFNIAQVGVDIQSGAPLIQRTNTFAYAGDPNGTADIFYHFGTKLGSSVWVNPNDTEFLTVTRRQGGSSAGSGANAVDNSLLTDLYTNSVDGTEGVQFQFLDGAFTIQSLHVNADVVPSTFEGSNDGTNWTPISNGAVANLGGNWTSIETPAAPAYTYFRLLHGANGSPKTLVEVKFYGVYARPDIAPRLDQNNAFLATHANGPGIIYLPDPVAQSYPENYYFQLAHIYTGDYTFSAFSGESTTINDNTNNGALKAGEQLIVVLEGNAWEINKVGSGIDLGVKGAILSRNSTETEILPVGSNGQFLRADSFENTGLKWETVGISDLGNATTDLNMGGNKITNLGTPTSNTDAVTKAYADSIAAGFDPKESCEVTTTFDIDTETGLSWVAAGSGVGKTLTTANASATIDGVVLQNGFRVLLKNEPGSIDNGIYDVSGVGGSVTLTRSTDFDDPISVSPGAFTFITNGTANISTGHILIGNGTLTPDSSPLVFSQFVGSGALNFNSLSDVNVGTPGAADDGKFVAWDNGTNRFTLQEKAGTAIGDVVQLENVGGSPGLPAVVGTQITLDSTQVSPLDTKGDIWVHDGSNDTKLPVGTDNDILFANSGEATGLKYKTITSPLLDVDHTATELQLNVPQDFDNRYSVEIPTDAGYTVVNDGRYDLTDGFTVEFWVQLDNLDNSTQPIINREFNAQGWYVNQTSGGTLRVGISDGTGANNSHGAVINATNTWFHIAVTWEVIGGTDTRTTVYRNGTIFGSSITGAGDLIDYPTSALQNLGFGVTPTGTSSNFAGKLDEIRIWKDLRTPTEISDNYNRNLPVDQVTDPNLIGYWRGEEGSGTTLVNLGDGPDANKVGVGTVNYLLNPPYQNLATRNWGEFKVDANLNPNVGDFLQYDGTKFAASDPTGTDIGDIVVVADVGGSPGLPSLDGSNLTNLTIGAGSGSPLDTSGDLYAHNGTVNIKLPAGANNTVLTPDDSLIEGLKYTDVREVSRFNTDVVDNGALEFTTLDLLGTSDIMYFRLRNDGTTTFDATAGRATAYYQNGNPVATTNIQRLFDKTILSNVTISTGASTSSTGLVIDFLRGSYVRPTSIWLYSISNHSVSTLVMSVYGAPTLEEAKFDDPGATFLGDVTYNGTGSEWFEVPVTGATFYRYLVLYPTVSTSVREVEVYGFVNPGDVTYTLQTTDEKAVLKCADGGTTIINCPSGFTEGFYFFVQNEVAGPVSISDNNGDSLVLGNNTMTKQGDMLFVSNVGSDEWLVTKIDTLALVKGDLIAHDGSDRIALPVGENSQILTADENAPSGFKWADQLRAEDIFYGETISEDGSISDTDNDIFTFIGTQGGSQTWVEPVGAGYITTVASTGTGTDTLLFNRNDNVTAYTFATNQYIRIQFNNARVRPSTLWFYVETTGSAGEEQIKILINNTASASGFDEIGRLIVPDGSSGIWIEATVSTGEFWEYMEFERDNTFSFGTSTTIREIKMFGDVRRDPLPGDLFTTDSSGLVYLPVGNRGDFLQVDPGNPNGVAWAGFERFAQASPGGTGFETRTRSAVGSLYNPWDNENIFGYLFDLNGSSNPSGSAFLTVSRTFGGVHDSEFDLWFDKTNSGNEILLNPVDGNEAFLDFGTNITVSVTEIVQDNFTSYNNGFQWHGSNDGTNWFLIAQQVGTRPGGQQILASGDTTPYRYFRYTELTSSTTARPIEELAFFGTYYSQTSLTYIIDADDLNRTNYLNIGAGKTIQFTIPDGLATQQGDYYRFVNVGEDGRILPFNLGPSVTISGDLVNSKGFLLINTDGADGWIIVKETLKDIFPETITATTGEVLSWNATTDKFELTSAASDNLILVSDSSEPGGVRWGSLPASAGAAFNVETKIEPGNIPFTVNGFNGIINAVGTVDGTESYTNPYAGPLDIRGKQGGGATVADADLSDQTTVGTGAVFSVFYSPGNGQEVIWVDFGQAEFVKPTTFSFYLASMGTIGGTDTFKYFTVEGSDNNSAWTVISNQLDVFGVTGSQNSWFNIPITDTTNFWRYLRLRFYNDDTNPGSGTTGDIREFEVYGEYITALPTGTLTGSDIGKLLLAADTSANYSLKVPDNTSIFQQGWYCYLKATTGNYRSFVSAVNIANINAATNAPSLNGPEQMGLLVNIDGADEWSFVNISTPSGRLTNEVTAAGTIELTILDEDVQIIDPDGANRVVVLPDPPIKNLYYKIVNIDAANYDIDIEETLGGGSVKTLDVNTPYVECHYTGTNWIILD